MARRPKDTPLPSTIMTRYTLRWSTRRNIRKNAKAAASHGWLPSVTQPEPHWVTEWDGENRSAIAALIANFEMDTVPVLQTIVRFNDADEVKRPSEVERTPESRREHQRWETYRQIRHEANNGVVMYAQRRETLLRKIQAQVDLSHSGRGVFYQKLSEYHPRPSEVKDLDVTPLSMESDFGGGPMLALRLAQQTIDTAVEKLRRIDDAPASEPGGQNLNGAKRGVHEKAGNNGHGNGLTILKPADPLSGVAAD